MKDAYYFSHDSNAKDDPKCVLLIEQLGMEGYGIFWVLIETLREQPEYKYPIALIPALARRYNTTSEKMRTVVMGYKLFEVENDEFFYSESLNRRMEKWDVLSQKQREKAFKRWGDAVALPEQCYGNADAMPSYAKKENKKKGNNNKENNKYIGDVFYNFAGENDALFKALIDFDEMRKKIKKPMTDRARQMIINELEKISNDPITQVMILEQSTLHCWQSIYALKGDSIKNSAQKDYSGGESFV